MVSYFNLLLTLEASRAQLPPVPLPSEETELSAWLGGRRQPEHHAADAACEEFALREAWPPIRNEGVVVQVHLRLLAAVRLCRELAQHPLPAGWGRREALRALLLDYWYERVAQWNSDQRPATNPGRPTGPNLRSLWSGRPGGGINLTLSE